MNIALIGMPTSGKSTVGVVLAKMLGYDFVDTDILIQNKYNSKLKDLIDKYGREGFLEIERDVIKEINFTDTIIATGGSAIYYKEAMDNLKRLGKVVYLMVPLNEIERRMTDVRQRGVVIQDGQTIKDLFEERKNLYEKYADYIVSEEDKSLEQTVNDLVNLCESINDK